MDGSNGDETNLAPGTRKAERDSMMMSGTIRRVGGDGAAVAIRIRNISSGGMMGEAEIILAPGEAVELTLKTIGQIEGTVAWTDQDRFGIAFAVPVDRLQARRSVTLNADRASPLPPRSRRPGLRTG